MDENENVFPLFEQKFLGICKAKIRGWIFVGMYNKTKTFLDKQLEKCPDSLRNFKAQNLRISQVMKNTTKDSHPGIFTMDFYVVK